MSLGDFSAENQRVVSGPIDSGLDTATGSSKLLLCVRLGVPGRHRVPARGGGIQEGEMDPDEDGDKGKQRNQPQEGQEASASG